MRKINHRETAMTDTGTSARKPYIAPRVIPQSEDTPDAPFNVGGSTVDSMGSMPPPGS